MMGILFVVTELNDNNGAVVRWVHKHYPKWQEVIKKNKVIVTFNSLPFSPGISRKPFDSVISFLVSLPFQRYVTRYVSIFKKLKISFIIPL